MDKATVIYLSVVAAAISVAIFLSFQSGRQIVQCEQAGGIIVRGVMGLVCLKEETLQAGR